MKTPTARGMLWLTAQAAAGDLRPFKRQFEPRSANCTGFHFGPLGILIGRRSSQRDIGHRHGGRASKYCTQDVGVERGAKLRHRLTGGVRSNQHVHTWLIVTAGKLYARFRCPIAANRGESFWHCTRPLHKRFQHFTGSLDKTFGILLTPLHKTFGLLPGPLCKAHFLLSKSPSKFTFSLSITSIQMDGLNGPLGKIPIAVRAEPSGFLNNRLFISPSNPRNRRFC
jgi:hypothetical protein